MMDNFTTDTMEAQRRGIPERRKIENAVQRTIINDLRKHEEEKDGY